MENGEAPGRRLAIVGVFVYDLEASQRLNNLLHAYAEYIVGRMGIPYRDKKVSVITVIVDAPGDVIGALSGKLGMIPNLSVKTIYSKQ